MPRFARLDAPGVLHYVMGRGIDKKEIFLNNTDYVLSFFEAEDYAKKFI